MLRKPMTIAVLSAMANFTLSGAVIGVSTFDTDDEGWTVGEFLPPPIAPVPPTHVNAGGNPDGFIRTGDIDFGNWNGYLAPAAFLGSWTAIGVTSVSYDTRVNIADATPYAFLIVESGAIQISMFGPAPALDVWTHYSFQTVSEAGWFYTGNGSTPGAPVTAGDFATVMGNVTALRISSDWSSTPDDQVDLDNVRLAELPEPASIALVGIGLVAGSLIRRRRRS